jgi:hypothetical protein
MESEGQCSQNCQMPNNYMSINHNSVYFLNMKISLLNINSSELRG